MEIIVRKFSTVVISDRLTISWLDSPSRECPILFITLKLHYSYLDITSSHHETLASGKIIIVILKRNIYILPRKRSVINI